MIQFLHTAGYPEKIISAAPFPSAACLLHHVQVYCLADKYSITLLKGLVTKHLDLIVSQYAATKHAYETTAHRDNTLNDILILLIIQMVDSSAEDEEDS